MVGRLDLSDSSTEVYRGSEAELVSTFESPEKAAPTPKKQKNLARVSFKLPHAKSLASDSDDYFEESDSPRQPSQTKEKVEFPLLGNERTPGTDTPHRANESAVKELEALNGLDIEDRQYYKAVGRGRGLHETKKPRQPPFKPCRKENVLPTEKSNSNSHLNDLDEQTKPPQSSREEQEHSEKMVLEREEEERKIAYLTAGRGRGPH